ncbi:MAG: GHKL domain-containing protein [Acetatifactor sp.]|nr:GHKL domain-containing protein [Acetatifactor sp.]
MSTLEILTGILFNNIFQAIWLCCILPEPKHSRKKTVLIVTGTTILYTFVALAICTVAFRVFPAAIGVFLGYIAGLIIYSIMYCFLLSASRPVKSLFLYTGYFSVHTIIITTVSIVTNTYALGNLLVWVLRVVFNLAVLIPWLLFFRERIFRMYKEIRSSYGIMSMISIMCYVIQTLFWVYNMQSQSRDTFFKIVLIYAFGLTVAMYLMIFRHIAQSDHANRMKQLQANEKFLQAQIDSYKKMGENARQTRHDFRHHSMVVAEYAKNKDYQAILSYLSEYDEKEREKYQEDFCRNHATDMVLSAYANRCEQNGIEISADVWLEETEGVSDYDLVTILANILENAVNGCMEIEGDRRIEISIGLKGRKLVMVCKNTCAPDILFEKGLPKNREREGIGVESILNTVAKYSGVVDFSASDGIFVCRVVLNNRKRQKK